MHYAIALFKRHILVSPLFNKDSELNVPVYLIALLSLEYEKREDEKFRLTAHFILPPALPGFSDVSKIIRCIYAKIHPELGRIT